MADIDDGVDRQAHFPLGPPSVAAARIFAAEALRIVPADVDVDDVLLLVSELAANAVVHAGTGFGVHVRADPSGVRVEFDDGSFDLPVLCHPGDDAVSGRGMLMVERLASAWGVTALPTGKQVWFEYRHKPQKLIA